MRYALLETTLHATLDLGLVYYAHGWMLEPMQHMR